MKKILLLMVAILLFVGCQPSGGKSAESGGDGGGGGSSPNPPNPTAIVTATPTPTTTFTATPTDTPTPSPTTTDTSTATASPTDTDTATATSTPTPSAAVLAISNGATYNFGSVASGSSTDKTFTVSRTGDSNATGMSGSGLAAPYTFKGTVYPGTGGTCGATLSAASCTIVVTLAPNAVGVYNDTIEINYNDGYAVQQATRPITGMVDLPWSRRYGGTQSEGAKPNNGYLDSTGNYYVAGTYRGAVDFGTGVLPDIGGNHIFVMKVDYAGGTQWVSTGLNSAGQTELYGFTGDSSGNSYAIGSFTQTLIISGTSLVSAGGWDTWVAKWNSSGVFQWAKRFGTAGDFEHGFSVATNSSNDVYIAGAIAGTVNFGGGARVLKGLRDYYIAKFDTSGTWLWDMTAGQAGVDSGNGATLYTDGGNNLISTGILNGTLTIGGVTLGTTCAACDFWVVKYNSAGVAQYTRSYPTNTGVSPNAMTSDSANNIYLTGYFQGTMGVDTGGGTLASAGQNDVMVIKLNASGVELWSKRFGGASFDTSYSIILDTLGNLLVSGSFFTTVNFGSGNITSAGLSDMFLMKLNKNTGAFQSVATWGSTGEDHAEIVRVDSINNSYIFGHFANTVNFVDGNQTSAGGDDLFIMKNVP